MIIFVLLPTGQATGQRGGDGASERVLQLPASHGAPPAGAGPHLGRHRQPGHQAVGRHRPHQGRRRRPLTTAPPQHHRRHEGTLRPTTGTTPGLNQAFFFDHFAKNSGRKKLRFLANFGKTQANFGKTQVK